MKAPIVLRSLMVLSALLPACLLAYSQPGGCTLKPPAVHIDFGKSSETADFNQVALSNYDRIYGSCPTDGHYTFTPATYDCFAGDWFTIAQDHTPGDVNGNMMLVNASPYGGVFFQRNISGLTAGRTYELALWMVNVCRLHICCSSLSPSVSFTVNSVKGQKLGSFRVGDLPQRTNAQWRKFAGFFTLPAGETSVVLTMSNNTIGGCGNDFALDDITFRECVPAQPEVVVVTTKTQKVPVPKPLPKKQATVTLKSPSTPRAAKADVPVAVTRATPAAPTPRIASNAPLPLALRTRSNPLIKQIETNAGELVIDLYDNGQIDGDTVSVYHNNQLVVSKARLSTTPIRVRISIDAANPYHELVMVAHNLGSIPPNTSLMVVTAGDEKHQVNISSSEQQNARVAFVWRE